MMGGNRLSHNRIGKGAAALGLLAFWALLNGCAGIADHFTGTSEWEKEIIEKNSRAEEDFQSEKRPATTRKASLWEENAPLSDMFLDSKARRVGDTVTVKIVESSSAYNKATTESGKESSISAGIDSVLDLEKKFPNPDYGPINPFGEVKAALENEFTGSGNTERSGKLEAYITATVREVFPNGNMRITGYREIVVNDERQVILLSGIIRPRDISPENIIKSTYISNARIAYKGSGIVNDRQRPGWGIRVLDAVWPF